MKREVIPVALAILLGFAQPALAWDPDRDQRSDEEPLSAWTPEAAPVAPPPGIYLVTETYAGDAVTHSGALTTYSTETVHETPGSYARVLERVATGGSSAYDGAAFNGRASLTDGRPVAGTYYENYIGTDDGFVRVSVVFFQDDSEIARGSWTGPPQPASTRLPDRSIEVLRGRRITLSLGGADVRGWRFESGEAIALGPLSGSAAEPFVARWDRLAPANGTWAVRFLVDQTDGTTHELVVRVTVRAPGLVE